MPKFKRRNPDDAHKHPCPSLDNEEMAADLEALLTLALYAQQAYIRHLSLRNRVLNLSLMLAAVSSVIVAAHAKRTRTNMDGAHGKICYSVKQYKFLSKQSAKGF